MKTRVLSSDHPAERGAPAPLCDRRARIAVITSAKGALPWLLSLFLFGCGVASLAPVRVANDASPPPTSPTPPPEVPAKPPEDLDKKMARMDKNIRDALVVVQRQLAAQEEAVRLLRGDLEVLQHENEALRAWMMRAEKAAAARDLSAQVSAVSSEGVPAQPDPPAADGRTGERVGRASGQTAGSDTVRLLATRPGQEASPSGATAAVSPQVLYDDALALLRNAQYGAAQRGFDHFLEKFPEDALSDHAQYWIGELYFVQRQYPEALRAFNQVLVLWPTSTKVPLCLLKIGFAFYELGDMQSANASLMRLLKDYPNSPAVVMARQRLRDMAGQRDKAGQRDPVGRVGTIQVPKTGHRDNPGVRDGGATYRTKRIQRVMGE